MITLKGLLNKKEKKVFEEIIEDVNDIYGDFYITRNNLRIYIKENLKLLYECLAKGDKIAYSQEDGVIFVTGYSDKSSRIYLKTLPKSANGLINLLKIIGWNTSDEIFIKIKKNNPNKDILLRNGFRYFGSRGKEILLIRKPRVYKGDNNANRTKN